MNKRLMLVAALTVALGAPVMAHEGESHDEPKTNNQDQDAEKAHKELEHKRHDAAEKAGDHKDGDHKDAKGAKSKKAMKKKGKKIKIEETKEAPAATPTK